MYPIYKIKLHNPTMHKPHFDTRTWRAERNLNRPNKFVPRLGVRTYKLPDKLSSVEFI